MIFYFSATGNTRTLAKTLATELDEKVFDITQITEKEFKNLVINPTESLGLVFPVYGWSIPKIVRTFIQRLSMITLEPSYVYAAMTCGDDVGMVDRHIRKALKTCSLSLNACYSICMPNTYVCLPGFDVDTNKIRQQKLSQYYKSVGFFIKSIKEKAEITHLKRGAFPYTKTYILGGIFRAFLLTDKPFRTNENCNHCGLCEKQCPSHNITLSEQGPQWLHHCTGCLSCYHHCPRHAIHYGKQTTKKGQYLFNNYKHEVHEK